MTDLTTVQLALITTNDTLEVAAKEQAEHKFKERIELAQKHNRESTTMHGLKTLKDVFTTCDEVVASYVLAQQCARRRSQLYVRVIKPAMDAHTDAILAAQEDKSLKGAIPSNPAKVLSYIIAEALTQSILGSGIKLTFLAKTVVNKLSFALDVVDDEVRDDAYVLAGMLAVVRSIAETHETLEVTQAVCSSWYVDFTSPEKEALAELNEQMVQNQMSYVPMVVKPRRHKNLVSGSGGYNKIRSPLLKSPFRDQEKQLPQEIVDFNIDNNRDFFVTLNELQETPYQVDAWLLNILNTLKARGITCPSFEWSQESADVLASDTANDVISKMEARYAEKGWIMSEGKKAQIHNTHVASARSKVQACLSTLARAEEYKDFDNIYYPMFTDRRGRIYPYVSGGLSIQGNTLGKALLSFGRGVLVNAEGRKALWMTLGACLGGDKLVVDKRAEFAKTFKKAIWAFMEDGDYSFVEQAIELEADEALLAIKFAREVYMAETDRNYHSHAIVHMDACSSAIQLTGLLQHCVKCATGTNLINGTGDKITDAYKQVSDSALSNLHSNTLHSKVRDWMETQKDFDYQSVKTELLAVSDEVFNRKVVKKSVMVVLSYGGSMLTSFDDMRDKLSDVALTEASEAFILRHLFYSLESSYPAPVHYQNWAQKLASAVVKRDNVFHFTSPQTGFPVYLQNKEVDELRMSYYEIGSRRKREAVIRKTLATTDTRKTATGAVPGIIHAIDAGLLTVTAQGLGRDFSPIHDSYGVHCNYATTELVPQVNYRMYELAKLNVMENIITELDLCPVVHEPPHEGTFNPAVVIKAVHAFT